MVIITTGIVGIVFIFLGVITLNGSYKRWYLGPQIFPPQAIVYATIPLGLVAIELCVVLIFGPYLEPDIAAGIALFTVGPTLIFGYILAFWHPKWIKPYWVNWLEENYTREELAILIATARRDPEAWEARVSTQEGLEAWAEEVIKRPKGRRK